MPQVITRFAPSPTGELHIGGARTALFAWAYARRHAGRFLLRLEDTDQARSSEASAASMLRDLQWLGLDWDNADDVPRQSQRLALYHERIDKLMQADLAYEDDGAIRFRMDRPIAFDDAVYGRVSIEAADLEDFVIRKGDGFPTFHLAVVVDDADMGVTHVIRGQEHLSNTAKHAALYDALGYDRPVWAHTPSIMNPDGSKMSKRDKAKAARAAALKQGAAGGVFEQKDVQAFLKKENDDPRIAARVADGLGLALPEIEVADFRRSGYLPGVLLNYLSLLGWNPGGDVERFDLGFLVEHFGLERINKANSKFDRDKLKRFNFDTLMAMPEAELAAKVKDHLAAQHPAFTERFDDGQLARFVAMYRERAQTLDDYAAAGRFFVEPPTEYVEKAVKKNLTRNDNEGLGVLRRFSETLAALDGWEAPALHAAIESFVQQHGLKNMGAVAQPLRVALTGAAVSPPIDQTLELLGRDETLDRIRRCLEALT